MAKLRPDENLKVAEIVSAALAGDWDAFRNLSDEPFLNESAMSEAFEMCADALQTMGEVKAEAEVTRASDGSRMVYATISGTNPDADEIRLIMHGLMVAGVNKVGIWVFSPMPKW